MRPSMHSARPFVTAVLTAAWVLAIPTALAQAQTPPQSPTPGQSSGAPNLSEEKINAAAAAAQQVVTIKEDYQQKLQAAEPADKQRIADEGKHALVKAVTDQGLSVEEYTAIIVVAENDATVREKILERIRPSAR